MSTGVVDTFYLKRHDRRPSLRLTVTQRSDGTPLDMTGASATFLMYDSNGTQKVNASAEIEIPTTGGVLRYDWASGDTDTAGEFTAEFEVDYGAGDKITIPNDGVILVRIIEDLNNA